MAVDSQREEFVKLIENMAKNHGKYSNKSSLFTRERLQSYIDKLKDNTVKKNQATYHIFRKYTLQQHEGTTRLMCKKTNRYYVDIYEIYDCIRRVHENKHNGERKIFNELKKDIANISVLQIKMYIQTCVACKTRRERNIHKKRVLLAKDFGERGYIYFINNMPIVNNFRTILIYQDHYSKYSLLRPVTEKTPVAVASHLFHIFALIGLPKVLQSSEDRPFVAEVIKEIGSNIWPQVKMIHAHSRHVEGQSEIVQMAIKKYLTEKGTTDWVTGLPFVQIYMNTTPDQATNLSPHNVVYGQNPPMKLDRQFPPDILSVFSDGVISSSEEEEDSFQRELSTSQSSNNNSFQASSNNSFQEDFNGPLRDLSQESSRVGWEVVTTPSRYFPSLSPILRPPHQGSTIASFEVSTYHKKECIKCGTPSTWDP